MTSASVVEEFNKDELEAPNWLNIEFFLNVLKNCEINNKNTTKIQVNNVNITPGSAKGDHYGSVMFRAIVNYQLNNNDESQVKSMIIKTMPEMEGFKKELLDEMYIFETEIGMYTEVLPKFEKILRSIGDQTELSARCIYHSLIPRKVIVLEDLVPLGYTVLRDRELNIEEVKIAYLKLAKWHAVSYKLLSEQPTCFEKYRHHFITQPSTAQNPYFTGGIDLFIELLDTEASLNQYKPYFLDLRKNFMDKCIALFTEHHLNPQDHSIYVLCHGDYHARNMMLKYSNSVDGKCEDVMPLDFQVSYVGSLANDLIYSIFMLLDADMREETLDELLYFYCKNFLQTLMRLDFKGRLPKVAELRKQIMWQKSYVLFMLVTFLPMWPPFRDSTVDNDKLMTSAEYRRTFYRSKEYIEELQRILPKLLHTGYLEA